MDNSQVQKALDGSSEVKITVRGRKTGREYSTPVWFVQDGKTVFIMPGGGSHSQWYRNAASSGHMKISTGKVSLDLTVKPVTDPTRLAAIVDRFREKYGPEYYSDPEGFDVALEMKLP